MEIKKIVKLGMLFLALLLVLVTSLSCDLLGGGHEHSFSSTWSHDANYHWQACSGCDEVRNKSEHDWNGGIVTQAPTTTVEGVKEYTCNTCGHKKYESIPLLEETHTHIFSLQQAIEKYLKTPADCTHKAIYYYSCSCGEKGTETFEYGEALGHSFSNYVDNNDATCTQNGTKTAKCDRCGIEDTVEIPNSAKGHTFAEEWTSDDNYHWHSATCEHTSEVSGKAEHVWDDGVVTKEPTIDEEGICLYTCTVCNKTKQTPIPKQQLFTVTFVDDDGTILKEEKVPSGKSATAPELSEKEGLVFKGWTSSFSVVTEDMYVFADYSYVYQVSFIDLDGKAISIQSVVEGSNATAPSNPNRSGYRFIGWKDEDNKVISVFDNINCDMNIYADYAREFKIVFYDNENKEIGNPQYICPSLNEHAVFPTVTEKIGYDAVWSDDLTNINSDKKVYLTYSLKNFVVTFISHDETVLKEQTVLYGMGASAPKDVDEYYMSWGEGYSIAYSFDGWDKEFENIYEDTTITAVYKNGYIKPIIAISEDAENVFRLYVCLPQSYLIYGLKINMAYDKRVVDNVEAFADSVLYDNNASLDVNTQEKTITYMWFSMSMNNTRLVDGNTCLLSIKFKNTASQISIEDIFSFMSDTIIFYSSDGGTTTSKVQPIVEYNVK